MPFKVLSYNIRDGGDDRLSAIGEVIRAQQPDAIALLEANSRCNAESLATALGMHLAYGEANGEFAVAWMSRVPIELAINHRRAVFAKTLLEVEILRERSHLRLFATHLVHGRTAEAAQRRAEEARAMLDILHPLMDQPHLLVGDFNAIHPRDRVGDPPPGVEPGYVAREPIQLILDAGYVDCYRKLDSAAPGYTYPAHHPWLRLDYIFASPSMAAGVRDGGVVAGEETKQASDHLAVWAEFS